MKLRDIITSCYPVLSSSRTRTHTCTQSLWLYLCMILLLNNMLIYCDFLPFLSYCVLLPSSFPLHLCNHQATTVIMIECEEMSAWLVCPSVPLRIWRFYLVGNFICAFLSCCFPFMSLFFYVLSFHVAFLSCRFSFMFFSFHAACLFVYDMFTDIVWYVTICRSWCWYDYWDYNC